MNVDSDHARKALVAVVVEKALLKIGKDTLDQVSNSLYEKHRCYLGDCYEHPEYLNEILKKLYGNAHDAIVKSIKKQLDEFSNHKHIARFLSVICQ